MWVYHTIANISTGNFFSNKLILHNLGVLQTIFLLLYNNEISDQICIDFSAEINQKLSMTDAKASCNALSAITELDLDFGWDVFSCWLSGLTEGLWECKRS